MFNPWTENDNTNLHPRLYGMEARTLDITAGIVTLILFVILLLAFQVLGGVLGGFGYIFALLLFIVIMTVAGYFINEKIA
jgi:hypothetical protein